MDPVLAQLGLRHSGSWKSVLDAGTGDSSLEWLCQSPADCWTAVTADPERHRGLSLRWSSGMRSRDRLLLGNWQSPEFLQGETFDLVLADYLLGACERIAPYFQEGLLERLLGLTQGWLYIVGLEPTREDPWMASFCDLRDAVLILSGQRPHRELPESWVRQQLSRQGAEVAWGEHFENVYDESFIDRELAAVEANLDGFVDRGLGQVLRRRARQLGQLGRERVHSRGGVRHSHDYLLAVPWRRI